MINREFSEHITVKSLLIPNKCTNYEGLTTMKLISIDNKRIIQQNPAKHDLTIYKGTNFFVSFIYKNKDTNQPYDLTDFFVEGKSFLINNNDIKFDLHPIIDVPSQGEISISLTPDETNNIFVDTCMAFYHYYINLISNTGYTYRILIGNIKVCQ